MEVDLEKLVDEAQAGSRTALEGIVCAVQDRVHQLATRILVNPEDALEATQEILILVITKLSTFRQKSAFSTWVYRVATNYLLNAKKVAERDLHLTFEMFSTDLENGLIADPSPPADELLMLNELRISCTMAMLLCLDMKHRLAYVLGDILEFEHAEAAEVLGISRSNFRQRLSRARNKVVNFTAQSCGLANKNAKCSCPRRLPAAIAMGRVNPDQMIYAIRDAPSYDDVVSRVKEVENDLKVLKLQTATATPGCPEDFGAHVAKLVEGTI